MKQILIYFFALSLISCGQTDKPVNDRISLQNNSEKTLLDHVKLAISPKFQDWVLFENGTYIIFDTINTTTDIKKEAIKLMTDFGPVGPGSPSGDFGVIHLNRTEGWVVSSDCYGMYTYVNSNELKTNSPTDVEIGLYGRSKREKDGNNPVIIHVNRKK